MESETHDHTAQVTANTLYGFWVYLMTDFILFATLFAAYAVLRSNVPQGFFNLPFALKETIVLLVSSFSCGMAMVGLAHHQKNKTLVGLALHFCWVSSFWRWSGKSA